MVNKRNKEKLVSKSVRKSLIISGLCLICMFVYGIFSRTIKEYWFICLLLAFYIFCYCYVSIFELEDRKKSEKKKAQKLLIQKLSYTDFKQVCLLDEEYENDVVSMMCQILKKEECTFYAKLTGKKDIYLIVKDKHNEKIYDVEIANECYFMANFVLKNESL